MNNDLVGKRFSVQVADGSAEYEVVEQLESTLFGTEEMEFVEVEWIRNEFDYIGIFGESAWVQADAIRPQVQWYERVHGGR